MALRRRIEEIYAEHTGKPQEQISDDLERDRFFTPDEAADYGLIDRVLRDRGTATATGASRVRPVLVLVLVVVLAVVGVERLAARAPRRGR